MPGLVRRPSAAVRPHQAVKQPIKVGPGEAPGIGDRGLLIAALEAQQAVLDLVKIGEVAWGQDLPLADRQVDLVE